MIRGSDRRQAEYPVDRIFIDRWSARAMTGEPLDPAELMVIFEAARWAPSSGNNQPWRILYAQRDTEYWPLFFDLLAAGNRLWATNAAALVVLISKTTFDNGSPSVTHSFDTGAAWENLALQAFMKGCVVHGMEGFDYGRARTALGIPEGYAVEAMVAIGRPAPVSTLSDRLQVRETPSDRRSLALTVCEGPYRL